MNTDFPEYIFNQGIKNESLYRYKIKQGQEIAKNKSIIFCGICRNVENTIKLNIERILRTSKYFKDYFVFFYENDSSDFTNYVLESYRSEKFDYISENRSDKDYRKDLDNGVDPWHYKRCQILAECRNKYLNYIEKNLQNYDYVCILDLDIKGGWSYEGFLHGIFTLESEPSYACVSSYGVLSNPKDTVPLETIDPNKYIMYDSFAFRPENWNNGLHILNTPMFNSIVLTRGENPIVVNSNFGGMAIYKKNTINGIRYKTKQWNNGEVDSEHILFNKDLINNGYKIILDPSMVISYSDHQFSRL